MFLAMQTLNRQQVLKWIPLAVDGELSNGKRRQFIQYLQTDEILRQEYESHLKLKKMIQYRCCRKQAPPHLRYRIEELIREEAEEKDFRERGTEDSRNSLSF